MANTVAFPSVTENFALPLLFAGQAQKEPSINHAFSVLDALLAGGVVDSLLSPPVSPNEGSVYRVLENAEGEWDGRDDDLALWIGGAWEFLSPKSGMRVYDQAARTQMMFDNGWQIAAEPIEPSGGSTVDVEARAAITQLIDALRTAGLTGNQT